MSQPDSVNPIGVIIVIAAAVAVGVALRAHANEPAEASFPCAILESSSGEAEVLDSSRTHLAEAVPKAPVPCGGWVSVSRGVAKLKQRYGYEIHLGPGTFAQFNDSADAILLFRGQLYSQANGGMGELRILTPNARVKVTRASAVTTFDSDEESTQLIALSGGSEIENRFDSAAAIRVKAGESSTLDFKLLRVVPSVPKVVAVASLKEKLAVLDVPRKSAEKTYATVKDRENQIFSEQQKNLKTTDAPPVSNAGRKLASLPATEPSGENARTDNYWQSKAVGGDADGLEILKQNAHAEQRSPSGTKSGNGAKVSVTDEVTPAVDLGDDDKLMQKRKQETDAEKQRVIEELSKIKSD